MSDKTIEEHSADLAAELARDAEFADWLDELRIGRADIDDLDLEDDDDRAKLERLVEVLNTDMPSLEPDEDGDVYALSDHFPRDFADEAYDRFREQEDPLSADREVTINVTLGTGGPACGVLFYNCDRDGFASASAWHQDWFTPKALTPLDQSTAETLWNLWGLDFVCEEDR